MGVLARLKQKRAQRKMERANKKLNKKSRFRLGVMRILQKKQEKQNNSKQKEMLMRKKLAERVNE